MFKNNLKIAWRNLIKQPFFTFLNTFGLAIGIASAILISLYVYDELSFDRMFADSDRIYRVDADIKFGGKAEGFAVAPAPMASTLLKDYSQVEQATRFRNLGSMLLRSNDSDLNVKENNTTFVDSTFFDLFGLDLLYGDKETALKNPNTLILTRSAAMKHFDVANALGQPLILDNDDTYTVTGVIDDLPVNSFLREHTVFLAMTGHDDALNTRWGSNNYATFIKFIPNIDASEFRDQMQNLVLTYVMDWAQAIFPGLTHEQFLASGNYLNYELIALHDIHLNSSRGVTELSTNSSMQNVYILSFIGLFLLVLASVNFMNLSTAHSLKRAKEVGIRKTLGSNKFSLVRQFLTESGLIALISLLFAILIAAIALPFFNELSGKVTSIPYANPVFWMVVVCFALFLGLFSGSYPSFFLSSFAPIKVLKGSSNSSKGNSNVRNSLVVFQFTISVFLIVSTVVVYQQINYIQSKDVGFNKEQILIVNDLEIPTQKALSLKNEVEKLSQVEIATMSSYLPTPSSRSDASFFPDNSRNPDDAINMQEWGVDFDYIETLDMEIIAGRGFDKKFSSDSSAMIINETAAGIMGFSPEEALNKHVTDVFGPSQSEIQYTIIGVVKNFHFESLRQNVTALSLTLGHSTSKLIVKLNPGDFQNTLANIENTLLALSPEQPFNYYFLDDSFNSTYDAEQRLGRIFITFTFLSILIACLGLFGLAAFNAEKRIKEIGVRKVMGASVGQIVYRLSVDFLKLVFVAIVISLPLGWYAMNKWLEDFTYRIEISWWVFVLAAFLAVSISILTVSYQSIKAAIVNPVKSLRSE